VRRIEEDRAIEFGINGRFSDGLGIRYGLLPVNCFPFGFWGGFDTAEKWNNGKEKGHALKFHKGRLMSGRGKPIL
jgi:hypothetical protein